MQQELFSNTVLPSLEYENSAIQPVAGVDEVGRGPLAGPVVAAAVILDTSNIPEGLNDSKKLSPAKRQKLSEQILAFHCVGFGEASVEEIDQMNILAASMLAMRRAVDNLPKAPKTCLVDGNYDPKIGIPSKMLIKGDSRSVSIAAASIIAKVKRDSIMQHLARDFPAYGWDKNAGYGVPHHLKALSVVGASPHHRKTFRPVHDALLKNSSITT